MCNREFKMERKVSIGIGDIKMTLEGNSQKDIEILSEKILNSGIQFFMGLSAVSNFFLDDISKAKKDLLCRESLEDHELESKIKKWEVEVIGLLTYISE